MWPGLQLGKALIKAGFYRKEEQVVVLKQIVAAERIYCKGWRLWDIARSKGTAELQQVNRYFDERGIMKLEAIWPLEEAAEIDAELDRRIASLDGGIVEVKL
jgi:hypothetical protein